MQDYVTLSQQAEEKNTKEAYLEALKLLNRNTENRFSELLFELDKVLELLILKLDREGKTSEDNLILGCQTAVKILSKRYDILFRNLLPEKDESADVDLEKEANKIRDSLKRHYEIDEKEVLE
jgi:hypothetical protein